MPRSGAVTRSSCQAPLFARRELDIEVRSDERNGVAPPVGLSVAGVELVAGVAFAVPAAALAVQFDDLAGQGICNGIESSL